MCSGVQVCHQLFSHLSRELVQVCQSLSDVVQRRYQHYTESVWSQHGCTDQMEDIARRLTALRAVVDYTEKVPRGPGGHRRPSLPANPNPPRLRTSSPLLSSPPLLPFCPMFPSLPSLRSKAAAL